MPDPETDALLGSLRVLAGRRWTATELAGGLTNRNYRVTTVASGNAAFALGATADDTSRSCRP